MLATEFYAGVLQLMLADIRKYPGVSLFCLRGGRYSRRVNTFGSLLLGGGGVVTFEFIFWPPLKIDVSFGRSLPSGAHCFRNSSVLGEEFSDRGS